jgi:alpha-tubulin suppressor-like RCC1 family protein
MKHTNKGYIGKPKLVSDDGKHKEGVWEVSDVYKGRLNDDKVLVARNMMDRDPERWYTKDQDPYYDTVRVHLTQPEYDHIMRDRSQYNNCDDLILDQVYRYAATSFFGPRYSHWSALFGENGYYRLNENNSQLQFGTDPFTIEFWIKRHRNDNTNHFIMGFGNTAGTSGGTGMAIYITSSNTLAFLNASTSTTITGSTILGIDEWIHIACVRTSISANGFKIYINGALDATGTCGNFHPTNSTNFYIGRDRVATQATGFWGRITDIRITKSAVYSAAFTKPTTALDMTIPNVIYHDSLTNRRFYSDYSNGPGVPVLLDSSQTVKVIDSPFFTETTKTSQAHGTHSAYLLDRNRIHKYLDIKPANTSLRLGTSPFTIEGWIYMDERATNNAICGKGTSTNGWAFWIDSSFRLRFTSFATEHYKTDAVTNNYIVYGGWYHVAAVREGTGANQFKLYVNGKLEYTGTNADNYSGQEPLYVFTHRDGGSYVANGYQCGIRISSVARYTSNFDVSTTTFIDNSMTSDNDVRFLTATCGTTKLMPTQANYIDYGKARVPQWRRGSEVRWGQHHPTSNTGFSFTQTDTASRVFLKSNVNYHSWTKADNYTWSKVDCGLRHMVGIQSDGTLWTWGENHYGQLGLGDQMTRTVPTKVGTDTNWAQCSAGCYFTVAIKTDGTLWTWGFNNYGQLGHNDGITRLVPRQVGTATNWREAWAFLYWDIPCVVALKTDNTMWAWGRNAWSAFSNGTSNNSSVPVQGGNSTADWSKVFTGWYCHLGIKTDGTLWAWGYNSQGQYGVGNTTWVSSAINVGGTGVTYLWAACGREFNLAIKSDGTLWGAGTGSWGSLGTGNGTGYSTWTQIGSANNWIRCWAARYTGYALNSAGELWAWGNHDGGMIGDGNYIQQWSPVKVNTGVTIANNYATKGGENWMCLVDSNGGRRVVGGNQFGQLGVVGDDSAFNWGTGDFSLEFWVRRIWDQDAIGTGAPTGYVLMSAQKWWNDITNGDTLAWSIKCVHNTNYIVIHCGGETVLGDETGNAPVTINNWVHFCWQRTNGFMCLYANGRKVSERYYPHKIAAQWNEITAMCDTTPYRHATSGLYGFMSDIRINKGTAAYSKNNVNPPEIEVPKKPLVPVTGTVFHTACGPIAMDYSGQTTYFNEVRNDGNREMQDYYAGNWSSYIASSGPYNVKELLEHNDISGKIRSYGDTWDATNWSESRSYWPTPANQYPEFSWISRMVKPWTIEFWFYGHQHWPYNGQQTNHRKLYTATSSGQEGWEIWYGRNMNDAAGIIPQKWGSIMFGLWTVGNATRQTFGSTIARPYRGHSWNHCAVVFDPTRTNKMAIFLNGERVAAQTSAFTGGQKTYNTYYLQNETLGQGGIHISDVARYNNDSTTYTIPVDGWTPDNNTISLTNSEAPYFSTKTGMNQMTYGIVPNYTQKKFGRGSFKFQGLDQTNGIGPDRIQWSKNNWAIYEIDMRQKDITIECWAQWWDQPIGSISFNGSQGFRLPSTGTLNQTDGTVEFWIKAATTQQANATIIDGTTNNTGSFIGVTNGKLVWSIKRDTHALITSKTTITDNQWHHIVCVKYQQSGVRSDGFLYVDGKLEGKSVAWVGSTTWNFSDGQIGRSRYNTGTDAGYAFTGLLCNFHYHNNISKYMSTWNRFGTTSTEGRWAPNTYASGTWNPIPVNYQNPSVSELDSNAAANSAGLNGGAGSTYLDYETGKIQVPKGPIPRLNSTVLLLNAESTTGAPGAGVTQLLSGQSIVYYGVAKDDSGNNFALTAAGTLPTRSTELPWYGGGSWETIAGRPLKTQEVNYGSTLFNYSGGPHVWRTEDGFWAMSYTSDFLYDQTYPRRITTIRSSIRAKNRSEGPDAFQHVCLQRSAHDFILWIDGVEAGRFTMSMQGAWDRPYQNDNQSGDYSNAYIQLGTHSNGSWQRGWCGYIHDFRVSMMGRYQSNVINGVSTMCHRNTVIPGVPTGPFPTSK